jgi:hypothetical protein
MSTEMSQFKETAAAHMERDQKSGGKWLCSCEACNAIRSLEGLDKMFAVRPLVRDLVATEAKMEQLPEGQEKQGVVELYNNLQDKLADEMAK